MAAGKALLIGLLLATGACSPLLVDPLEQLRASNQENLAKISPGMTRAQVESVMGHESAGGGLADVAFGRVQYLRARNPMREETLKGRDGAEYLVLFYYTDVRSRDDKITDDELTPVAFRDGKVAGIGYAFLGPRTAKYRDLAPRP